MARWRSGWSERRYRCGRGSTSSSAPPSPWRWRSLSDVVTKSPIGSVIAIALVAGIAWYLPSRRAAKRIKQIQEQLPDALALMSASVEGGQTFQRSIDMYRRDAKAPLSEELDRVMAEVAVGSDLVVALENMAERSGVEDLTWAVEAVRIQQSTGGRLAPILHTLADFMRTRQEVRREVQTLSAEGRMSGYVLVRHPALLGVRARSEGPQLPRSHDARRRAHRAHLYGGTDGARVLDRASHGQHQDLNRGSHECDLHLPLVGMTLMVMGLCGVGIAAWRSHKVSSRLEFIRSLGTDAELFADAPPVIERVQTPLFTRVFGPAARGVQERLVPALPVERGRSGAR